MAKKVHLTKKSKFYDVAKLWFDLLEKNILVGVMMYFSNRSDFILLKAAAIVSVLMISVYASASVMDLAINRFFSEAKLEKFFIHSIPFIVSILILIFQFTFVAYYVKKLY
jgi:hypothetical protein